MKKLSILFSLLFIAVVSNSINAQDQNQKDREQLIKAARFLEEKPLDEKAKAVRGWAVSFVIKTDQVSVVVCGGDFMKPLLDKKNKNGAELISQYTIGMAAFKLEHPDSKDDEDAAQLAGVESALKAYEAIIKEKPKTSLPGMDDLISKRNKGELRSLVEAAHCAGKK